MRRAIFLAICFVWFTIAVATAQPAASDLSIVVPNYNLIPNDKINSGDTLYGLYNTNLGYVILPSKIVVDCGVDDQGRKFTIVRVREEIQPLFLIAGLPSLKSGKVKTLFSGEKFLFPGQAFNLTSEEQETEAPTPTEDRYSVRAFGCALDRFKKSLIYDYTVKLFRGDEHQVLDYYRVKDEQKSRPKGYGVIDLTDHLVTNDLRDNLDLPVLIWAGDLDRDQKPDLFMWWPCPGKDAGVFSLFLSSSAKRGDFVAKVPVGVRLKSMRGEGQ